MVNKVDGGNSSDSNISDNNEIKLLKDDSNLNNVFSQNEEVVKTVQLYAENFDISKKTEETQVVLAKKWMDSTKKIEIPIKYEEILINGKEFDSYSESEIKEIFTKIKDKITHVFSNDENKEKTNEQDDGIHSHHNNNTNSPSDIEIREYKEKTFSVEGNGEASKTNQNDMYGRRSLPLSINSETDGISNMEKDVITIPLWGEEIVINKRMVKLGEIVVKKYEGIEKRKVDVDVKTEKITIRYPDRHKEEII